MGRPVILSDSVFNTRIYSGHVLDASSTATGKDVADLASGRRIRDLTGWFASDLNTEAWAESTFDQLRAFDLLWIDCDHNLAGESISLRLSDDDFTTTYTLGPKTVPTDPTPFARLYDGEIVMTDEGALLWWTDLQVTHAVRFVVAAMGAGLRPELAGLMLGKLFTPEHAAIKPWNWGRHTLTHVVERSSLGQDASGERGRYRSQETRLRVGSWAEYYEARYPLEDLFLSGRPTVYIPDDESAERAALVRATPGMQGFEVPDGQYWPEIVLSWEEVEPELLS